MKTQQITIQEKVQQIADSSSCTEQDEQIIKYLALNMGFRQVIVTCGLVYPMGHGQAMSIQAFAQQIINAIGA